MNQDDLIDKQKILKQYWGHKTFRPLQEEVINQILQKKDVLALLPTGGGKSLCYQLPALMMNGVCLVISPLIALMKDQVDLLQKKGIKADLINSTLSKSAIDRILDNAIYGKTKMLYLSPERIQSELFQERLKKMKVSFIAVDEAHCISQWGYDFRPSYLNLNILRELKSNSSLMAVTATATPKVVEDIQNKLSFRHTNVIRQSFKRSNIHYRVIQCENKITVLKKVVKKECTLIYVRSRRQAELISEKLNQIGISSHYYHAGLDTAYRNKIQSNWMNNQFLVMVATTAFGMGIDKADVRTVIHYDVPESLESFYQESGRAGRDGLPSYSISLIEMNDGENLLNRISSSFPHLNDLQKTYQQFCNMHQIPLGYDYDISFEVDIDYISSKLNLYRKTVYYCFKQLYENGYLSEIQEGNSSYLVFKSELVEIDRFIEKYNQHKKVIHCVMRSYPFSIGKEIKISERMIASRSEMDIEKVIQSLKIMHQYGLITYFKSEKLPKVKLAIPRIKSAKIHLSKNTKNNFKRQVYLAENMLQYLNENHTCRNQILLTYFGESNPKPCLKCDNCDKKVTKKNNPNHILKNAILMTLKFENKEVKTIQKEFEYVEKGQLKNNIKELLEKGQIEMKLNKLSIV